MNTPACTCAVDVTIVGWERTIQNPTVQVGQIRHCPMHAAAPRLVAAARRAMAEADAWLDAKPADVIGAIKELRQSVKAAEGGVGE